MKEAPVYKSLEHCRQMMAIKSTSDHTGVKGGNNDISSIAEGALSHAKRNAPDGIDKLMYGYLIDAYVGLINKEDKRFFKNRAKRYTLSILKRRGMRGKRAIQIRDIAIHCLLEKNLTSAERARMMKVSDDNYCKRYRDCVDDLLGFFYSNLAIADDLAKKGMREFI